MTLQPAVAAIVPPWLPKRGVARREFDRLAERFTQLRIMTELDGETLAMGCMALAEYLELAGDPRHRRQASAARRAYLTVLGKFAGGWPVPEAPMALR